MSNLEDVRDKKFPVKLDKIRNIKFNLNSFCELEEKFGDINKAFAALGKGTMKSTRTLLWAGLIHEDETLTEIQVGDMIDFKNLQEVSKIVEAAMEYAQPKNVLPEPNRETKRLVEKMEKKGKKTATKIAAGTGQD